MHINICNNKNYGRGQKFEREFKKGYGVIQSKRKHIHDVIQYSCMKFLENKLKKRYSMQYIYPPRCKFFNMKVFDFLRKTSLLSMSFQKES